MQQLDQCIALPVSEKEMKSAMELSLRWAQRCKTAFGDQPNKALFGIFQGGENVKIRERSAQALKEMNLKGMLLEGLQLVNRKVL
ncbi:hypothetical protein RM11_0743 [Bartonella quintana RM-11]|nr:tRNA-guanine transglycosylase [Bartonella quintana]AFR26464.1 hypothetical protein RM11_0743 [Bartonella quintana RM-11]